jgi:hypothetical protein
MECIIPPGKSSTKHLTSERVIDYILASPNIRHIISNVKFKTDTLAQHFAIELEIEAKPRTLQVNTLKQPTLLPMQEALEQYEKLNNYNKWQTYKKAKNRAQQILQKTKDRTGIAILGSPSHQLTEDPKYNPDQRIYIAAGEILAKAALAAELFILDLAQIPRNKQKQYTGRSQYPSFQTKPLAPRNTIESKFACPKTNIWAQAHSQLIIFKKDPTDENLALLTVT